MNGTMNATRCYQFRVAEWQTEQEREKWVSYHVRDNGVLDNRRKARSRYHLAQGFDGHASVQLVVRTVGSHLLWIIYRNQEKGKMMSRWWQEIHLFVFCSKWTEGKEFSEPFRVLHDSCSGKEQIYQYYKPYTTLRGQTMTCASGELNNDNIPVDHRKYIIHWWKFIIMEETCVSMAWNYVT